jgi:hypothetical protein
MAMATLRKIGGCTVVSLVLLSCAGWIQDRRIGARIQGGNSRIRIRLNNGQVALSGSQAGADIDYTSVGSPIGTPIASIGVGRNINCGVRPAGNRGVYPGIGHSASSPAHPGAATNLGHAATARDATSVSRSAAANDAASAGRPTAADSAASAAEGRNTGIRATLAAVAASGPAYQNQCESNCRKLKEIHCAFPPMSYSQ